MDGWVKLHRKFLEWQWFKKPEMISIFIFLLLKANHNGAFWQLQEIKRGQLITSIENISNSTGISFQSVRTCLKKLENSGEINKQTTNKYTIITICNYDSYQADQQTKNSKSTNKQQTTNKQLTTNNNNKECKEEKEGDDAPDFYNLEFEKLTDEKNIQEYKRFISILNGDNELGRELSEIKSIPEQVTYSQFEKLLQKSKEKNKKFSQLLITMVNKPEYYKKKKSLYLTINTWLNNDYK